jgi:hypothetical protein
VFGGGRILFGHGACVPRWPAGRKPVPLRSTRFRARGAGPAV